jgi:HTH-type transcriptional regulator, sugar sensing transcriptional regulator
MPMDSLLPSFTKLGLTTFEAKAYLSLLQKGNVTGYELSKASGIPSSKIYSVLNHLVGKDLIVPLEAHPVRYLPRTPEEAVEKMVKEFGETFSFLKKELGKLQRRPDREEVVARNILGKKEIFRKAREIIHGTKHSLYLALWKEEWRSIHAALKKVHTRGIKISVVAYGPVPGRLGKIYQHAPSDLPFRERRERRFVLISDDQKALFANFSLEDSEKAVWTENKGLVLLVRDFIIHEIYIVKIREAFPDEIVKAFGAHWEKIRLPAASSFTGTRS